MCFLAILAHRDYISIIIIIAVIIIFAIIITIIMITMIISTIINIMAPQLFNILIKNVEWSIFKRDCVGEGKESDSTFVGTRIGYYSLQIKNTFIPLYCAQVSGSSAFIAFLTNIQVTERPFDCRLLPSFEIEIISTNTHIKILFDTYGCVLRALGILNDSFTMLASRWKVVIVKSVPALQHHYFYSSYIPRPINTLWTSSLLIVLFFIFRIW